MLKLSTGWINPLYVFRVVRQSDKHLQLVSGQGHTVSITDAADIEVVEAWAEKEASTLGAMGVDANALIQGFMQQMNPNIETEATEETTPDAEIIKEPVPVDAPKVAISRRKKAS